MATPTLVPVCPAGPKHHLHEFLVRSGFPGDSALLDVVVDWLYLSDVTCELDFAGLCKIADISGADKLPSNICEFP